MKKRLNTPPLVNGDRLTQPEFHRRYLAMPEDFRAELIGRIVFVCPPVPWTLGQYSSTLCGVVGTYSFGTPVVDTASHATVILDLENEPQPDLAMRIPEEYGGQTTLDADGFLVGAPELVVEVAHGREAIEMHLKKRPYQQAGVLEYLVFCAREQEIHWFSFQRQCQFKPDAKGIFRSRVFPGLWLDRQSLLANDGRRLLEVVRQGLESSEHANFVQKLSAFRKPPGRKSRKAVN